MKCPVRLKDYPPYVKMRWEQFVRAVDQADKDPDVKKEQK